MVCVALMLRCAGAGDFHGIYRHQRERMDYSYHVNYVRSRQLLQDEIVSYWRSEGIRADRPWVIFTAGAMGAGKSHTAHSLCKVVQRRTDVKLGATTTAVDIVALCCTGCLLSHRDH